MAAQRDSSKQKKPDDHRQRSARDVSETVELAAYIAEMTSELATLAGRSGMPMLCYFLNLARVEADLQARRDGA